MNARGSQTQYTVHPPSLFLQLILEFSLPWDQPDTRDACDAN